ADGRQLSPPRLETCGSRQFGIASSIGTVALGGRIADSTGHAELARIPRQYEYRNGACDGFLHGSCPSGLSPTLPIALFLYGRSIYRGERIRSLKRRESGNELAQQAAGNVVFGHD